MPPGNGFTDTTVSENIPCGKICSAEIFVLQSPDLTMAAGQALAGTPSVFVRFERQLIIEHVRSGMNHARNTRLDPARLSAGRRVRRLMRWRFAPCARRGSACQ
jgi:hypothetical protein